MEAKRVKYDIPKKEMSQDMSDFLVQFEKEAQRGEEIREVQGEETRDINQTLHHLEEGITSIRYCLEKPKKRVTLNEVNQKVDKILEILNSWNTN